MNEKYCGIAEAPTMNQRHFVIPVEDVARICHEANRAYCITMGDNSQPAWDDAPEWQKESIIDGLNAFIKEDCFLASDMSHNRWMDRKLKEGWKYGPVKDVEKKEHPCLLTYHSLPVEQKRKDHIFTQIAQVFIEWKPFGPVPFPHQ